VGGDDIQQLAREDGVDRLAVAAGEAFQGQDLEAGDAHFQAGQAEELGDGVGEVGAEGGSDRFRKRSRRMGQVATNPLLQALARHKSHDCKCLRYTTRDRQEQRRDLTPTDTSE
jgi:hypothetical protein